ASRRGGRAAGPGRADPCPPARSRRAGLARVAGRGRAPLGSSRSRSHHRQGDARPGRRTVSPVTAPGWVAAGAAVGLTAWAGYGWGAPCALPLLAVRRGAPGTHRGALPFHDGPDPRAAPRPPALP